MCANVSPVYTEHTTERRKGRMHRPSGQDCLALERANRGRYNGDVDKRVWRLASATAGAVPIRDRAI